MNAAGCAPSVAPARAPRALRAGSVRRCAPRAAARVVAQESMSEAYARIRAQRAKTKARFEREEKLEKAGALGKLLGGVIGGALAAPLDKPAPEPRDAQAPLRTWHGGRGPPARSAGRAAARTRSETHSVWLVSGTAGPTRRAARRVRSPLARPRRVLTRAAPLPPLRLAPAQRLISRRTSRLTATRWLLPSV